MNRKRVSINDMFLNGQASGKEWLESWGGQMNEILIRKAEGKDSAQISHLITQHLDTILTDPKRSSTQTFLKSVEPEAILENLKSEHFFYLIATFQEDIVATIGMRNGNHLFHLFVAKQAQGHGLASKLWQVAKKLCQEQGHDFVTVNATPNAEMVYLHFGFKPTGPLTVKNGVAFIPMALNLKEL